MKKLFFVLFTAGAFLAFGCSANDNKAEPTTGKEERPAPTTPAETTVQTPTGDTLKAVAGNDARATAELCNCMNDALRNMNPKIRGIIIKAGKSQNPELTLQNELLSIANTEEAQQIAQEFQQLQENNKVENCSAEIKRKYNLDDDDKTGRDKLMKAAAENKDCELVYALMKISVQQMDKGGNGGNQ